MTDGPRVVIRATRRVAVSLPWWLVLPLVVLALPLVVTWGAVVVVYAVVRSLLPLLRRPRWARFRR